MDDSETGPVAVPRQVHCELQTLRQMGTHDLLSEEVFDALEAYHFEAAEEWILDHPEEYVVAVYDGTRDETLLDGESEEQEA